MLKVSSSEQEKIPSSMYSLLLVGVGKVFITVGVKVAFCFLEKLADWGFRINVGKGEFSDIVENKGNPE
jgi:hypothetical protein